MEKSELIGYRALAREVCQLRICLGVAGECSELQALYTEKLNRRNAQLLAIERAIDTLVDPGARLILRHRYIDGLGWNRICAAMATLGYSERSVYRLHGEALLKLKEV